MLESATAHSTQASYSQGMKCYDDFVSYFELEKIWPPTLDYIVQFICFMSVRNLAQKTAKLYVAGISYHLKLGNHLDLTQNFLVRKLLEGYRRKASTHDSRMPITLDLLEKLLLILPLVCYNDYEVKLFSAAYSMAFFGFFRVGELTGGSHHNTNHSVRFQDVELFTKHGKLRIILKHSKTDQEGRGEIVIIENDKFHSSIRPVSIISDYLNVRPEVPGNLFCHYGGQPLTRVQFTAVLHKAIMALGLDSTKFKSHSFRIGAATTAAMLGFSEDEICRASRWKSKSYQTYIRK